jgi:Zn-finger nucleic acid-binding protein
MSELICPKCGAAMRAYQRGGLEIEQCVGCRGIFLDRGELERLTDAETASYGAPRHRDDDDDARGERSRRHAERPSKRRGFLDDLLDFG